MEPDREIIEDLMRRYRYEEEAVIAYHLREARTRLRAAPGGSQSRGRC